MGTRFWKCSCRCSQENSDDEDGTDFLREQFAVVYMCKQYRSSNSFVAVVLFSKNFGASPTVSAGSGARADDDNRMQVDSLKKGKGKSTSKHQNQEGTRTNNTSNTDINT